MVLLMAEEVVDAPLTHKEYDYGTLLTTKRFTADFTAQEAGAYTAVVFRDADPIRLSETRSFGNGARIEVTWVETFDGN